MEKVRFRWKRKTFNYSDPSRELQRKSDPNQGLPDNQPNKEERLLTTPVQLRTGPALQTANLVEVSTQSFDFFTWAPLISPQFLKFKNHYQIENLKSIFKSSAVD